VNEDLTRINQQLLMYAKEKCRDTASASTFIKLDFLFSPYLLQYFLPEIAKFPGKFSGISFIYI
jgi:hypothetical protein